MLRFLDHHRIILGIGAILGALTLCVPIVNASSPLPRALFLPLPADMPEPRVSLGARPDPDGRWTLDISASDFEFTTLCVANARAVPRGHAHVIKNGAKLASAFAPEFDLGLLPAGRHEIRVVLRGQDHRALVGHGGLIEASLTLDIPASPAG
jgi:hypothetical protein